MSKKLETEVTAPNSTVCFNFPETNPCRNGLIFIWPRELGSGRSCECPARNNALGRDVFDKCISGCTPDFRPRLMENGSFCFFELTSDMNETLVHFNCKTDECTRSDCFINTILSSNRIVIAGKTIIIIDDVIRFSVLKIGIVAYK